MVTRQRLNVHQVLQALAEGLGDGWLGSLERVRCSELDGAETQAANATNASNGTNATKVLCTGVLCDLCYMNEIMRQTAFEMSIRCYFSALRVLQLQVACFIIQCLRWTTKKE